MRRLVDCALKEPRELVFSVPGVGTIQAVFDGDVELADATIDHSNRRVRVERAPSATLRCLVLDATQAAG